MTGVINVGVRLPAVIFPVVIRPSGGLTSLMCPSLSLFYLCLSASLCGSVHASLFPCVFVSVNLHRYCFFPPPLTLNLLPLLTACCPWPTHPSLCNGNPLMYAAILVLQYVNWRDLESHLCRGQHPSKWKLHRCCNYHKRVSSKYSGFHKCCKYVLALSIRKIMLDEKKISKVIAFCL